MTGIKFDEEKVINCIKSYHDMHGEYPYLICGEETRKIIPEEKKDIKAIYNTLNTLATKSTDLCINGIMDSPSIEFGGKKYIAEDSIKCMNYGTWYGAKILVDNNLKFGEILIR